ncbi:MAG: hypothetical protein Q8903_01635 [Bacteroidota bacterium]|nr:hypothetical protein [Bacteroidota bacterium]
MELKKMFKRVRTKLTRERNPVERRQRNDTRKVKNPFKKMFFKHTTFK